MKITLAQARRLALRGQGLDGSWAPPAGKEGVAQAIERLGYVQIDTIAVVERAHHHTLWSRCPDYAPAMLDELQNPDRRIFEYWWRSGASYLPMADYRYHRLRMIAHAQGDHVQEWFAKNTELERAVLERIRQEGPLTSGDFEAPGRVQARRLVGLETGQARVGRALLVGRADDLRAAQIPKGL